VSCDVESVIECPITRSPLRRLAPDDLVHLHASVRDGELRHLDGTRVTMDIGGAFATPDGRIFYPIIDGIYVLLPSFAIVPVDSDLTLESAGLAPETDSVMRFYDEVGWQKGDDDAFADAELFEDLRPVSADYIHKCHMRVKRYLPPTGRYLLDAASGPIQYPEYLTYSEGYDARICADISFTALRAAKEKLGDKGIYLQCDVTRLPLRDGTVDGFVSLHTIYHIPAELQLSAFEELQRVLAPGKTGVVVYSWGVRSVPMTIATFNIRGVVQALLPRRARRHLYFKPHSYRWLRRNVATDSSWTLAVWRSVNVTFMRRYVHGERGKRLLDKVYRLEERWPRLFGRLGQYPLLVYRKPQTRPSDTV